MPGTDLDQLEASAYRGSFSDGLIDLFAGLSLLWIGACWLWLEAIAPFAALLPAALAPTLVPLRRRVVEPRVGYVRWASPRRAWERQQLVGLVALGAGALGVFVGLAVLLSVRDGSVDAGSLASAIPAGLVAVPVIVIAAATGLRRVWGYAAVLLLAAAGTVAVSPQPGWPLLIGGIAMLVTGAALFARFIRTTPAGYEA